MESAEQKFSASRETAFEELFRTHHKAVLAYAARRTDRASAHDVTAETFAIAWRRFDIVPADAPLPWLLGVARRVLSNVRRSERRFDAVKRLLEHEHASHPLEIEGRIGEALSMLGESDREALLLVAWEGLSAKEAAESLGILHTSFRVRYHRARRRLAFHLDELERRDPGASACPERASSIDL